MFIIYKRMMDLNYLYTLKLLVDPEVYLTTT